MTVHCARCGEPFEVAAEALLCEFTDQRARIELLEQEAARMTKTYTIILTSQGMAIHCDICGAVSWNPNDVEHKYYSNCNTFHEDPLPNFHQWHPVNVDDIPQPTIAGLLEQIQVHNETIAMLRERISRLEERVAELEKGKSDENH